MRRIIPFFVLVLMIFLMGKFLMMSASFSSNVTPKELTQEEKEIIVWQAGQNARRALTHRMMFN